MSRSAPLSREHLLDLRRATPPKCSPARSNTRVSSETVIKDKKISVHIHVSLSQLRAPEISTESHRNSSCHTKGSTSYSLKGRINLDSTAKCRFKGGFTKICFVFVGKDWHSGVTIWFVFKTIIDVLVGGRLSKAKSSICLSVCYGTFKIAA